MFNIICYSCGRDSSTIFLQVFKVSHFHNNNIISNGNRTEWSPIQSVIIRVINKIAVVRFV